MDAFNKLEALYPDFIDYTDSWDPSDFSFMKGKIVIVKGRGNEQVFSDTFNLSLQLRDIEHIGFRDNLEWLYKQAQIAQVTHHNPIHDILFFYLLFRAIHEVPSAHRPLTPIAFCKATNSYYNKPPVQH